MRAVIQRVAHARVTIEGNVHGAIDRGLLVLLGIEDADHDEDIAWLAGKIMGLRIFNDAAGQMNLSIKEIHGSILLISQFTLFAATKKGNRPGFTRAAKPEVAIPLYEKMIKKLESLASQKIETGIFGADMKVELLNDGPVTILIDSKERG
ncbi:MAG: D-tyrosyl-tRNA(Tyr) deacylase [Flavisolibacter sp.]|jgi:D-tyrosyl-tRNA(Tyr) deacylase|nr:D-tyrosyl-tRNA(Tyr) deacylase [Flavisolibacter sp.]